ncbi:hypothetical protein T10_7119 [Trichinella papuae]|uniref:Uncharacterized protein n=1 Tax=Trichinella papuae TaxID=268474 RepID=A0A0V1MDT6_9BILA|nr:hypothetical protein T10_7119 [Trichinella papuae]
MVREFEKKCARMKKKHFPMMQKTSISQDVRTHRTSVVNVDRRQLSSCVCISTAPTCKQASTWTINYYYAGNQMLLGKVFPQGMSDVNCYCEFDNT